MQNEKFIIQNQVNRIQNEVDIFLKKYKDYNIKQFIKIVYNLSNNKINISFQFQLTKFFNYLENNIKLNNLDIIEPITNIIINYSHNFYKKINIITNIKNIDGLDYYIASYLIY